MGCVKQPLISTKEVYIPVKCGIEMPVKPVFEDFKGVKYKDNDLSKEYAIFLKKQIDSYKEYIFILEKDLNFCIKGLK